jgi:dihydrofolate reductase
MTMDRIEQTVTGIVCAATSLDGYIARPDDGLDWFSAEEPSDGDEADFNAFLQSVDALVMGRRTYETVLGFGSWPYRSTPVFVLSHRGGIV